jgi:hypothetical protein
LTQTSTVCRHFAARRRPLSRADLFRPHLLPAKEKAAREWNPLAARSPSKWINKPVPAFVVALCPAPPVNTQTRLPLPCSVLARLPPTSTCRPLPDWAFQTPGRPCPWHRKNHLPAATVLPSLAGDLHPADHVPRECYFSGLAPYVPGSRQGIVSAKSLWRFLGIEHRSIPLSAGAGFSQFGAVFGWIHWQALFFGPFMVELFVVEYLPRSPSVVLHPVPPVARLRTPHASQVERTPWARTPWTGFSPALCHRGLPSP